MRMKMTKVRDDEAVTRRKKVWRVTAVTRAKTKTNRRMRARIWMRKRMLELMGRERMEWLFSTMRKMVGGEGKINYSVFLQTELDDL